MKKMNPREIRIEEYDYCLPDDRIAKKPTSERVEAKLLSYIQDEIRTHKFSDLPELLPAHPLMVINDTKVIQARMQFYRPSGARIEVFCLEPHLPQLYEESLASRTSVVWHCLIGQARKWKEQFLTKDLKNGHKLVITRIDSALTDTGELIQFDWDSGQSFAEILDEVGELPIPPYLNRATEESDLKDYQTVYAQYEGSVAAPTAGLHFDNALLKKLMQQGVEFAPITLHVGAGTFLPVKSATMADHPMHSEVISIPLTQIQKIRDAIAQNRKVIAIGTTSTRTLESLYYIGVNLIEHQDKPYQVEQWVPYDREYSYTIIEALDAIIYDLQEKGLKNLIGQTRIIIVPSFKWRIVDYLITNFHQPHSTLLLLVSAFIGDDWQKVYDYALKNDYRFLSYGDGSILQRK